MRHDDDRNAVSLFSFQDIITSITGIMFLVVLLLLLIAVTPRRTPGREPDDELQQQLARLRDRLRQYETLDHDLDERIARLRRLTPRETAARLQMMRQAWQDARSRREAAEREKDRSALAVEQLAERQNDVRRTLLALTEQIRRSEAALPRLTRQLEELRRQAARNARVLEYAVENSTRLTPVLTEVGGDGVRLLATGENREKDFRLKGRGLESVGRFLAWAGERRGQPEYYLLIFKPGGFRYAAILLDKLREYGFRRGVELLPDDTSTIFAEDSL